MADPFYNPHWNPVRPLSSKPKVINVPVTYVGSDTASSKKPSPPTTVSAAADRNAAAVTIQKAVRGFLVRMNVRVVRQIAMEVDEIERKVREEEVKIRMDNKARIRVSEELMALLLRLDSVRWVRDLRKKMIRRVMGLQEVIDSIMNEPGMELEIEIPAAVESPAGKGDLIVSANGGNPTSIITGDQPQHLELEMEIGEEGTGLPESATSKVGEPSEELRGLREMMERMAVENETLKMMVARLCETSAEQCRLMEGLAGRVSNMERVVHRADRRKKSKSGAARR